MAVSLSPSASLGPSSAGLAIGQGGVSLSFVAPGVSLGASIGPGGIGLSVEFGLFSGGGRSIDTIVPHAIFEEVHRDDLFITDHPVETGAAISDHAFKKPSSVEMRCGWSDATAASDGYVREVYAELLALQKRREPFDVSTGKRAYTNMLLSGIGLTTDESSEFALMVNATLREVIITSTSSTNTTPTAAQRDPQRTGSVNAGGERALVPSSTGRVAGPV